MAQYHPAGLVGRNQRDRYHEIDRQLARDEYESAAGFAGELGLRRLDRRSRSSGLRLSPALFGPFAVLDEHGADQPVA